MVIAGPIARADVPALCGRVRVLLECGDVDHVICDTRGLVDPDIGTVDALARLQLTARRLGCQIQLRHASPELRELLDLVGLAEVLPVSPEPPS